MKGLLDQLAAKLVIGGVEILNRNPVADGNLWYSQTTNHYDGYFNIYDPASNVGWPDVQRDPVPESIAVEQLDSGAEGHEPGAPEDHADERADGVGHQLRALPA